MIKGYDDKQQRAIATLPAHIEAHRIGRGWHKDTTTNKLRVLAGWVITSGNMDAFDMSAFILGTMDLKLTLHDLATETAAIIDSAQ